MKKFMIEKLRVSGAGKIDGVVDSTDGLNIIQGRSNTGKMWILKCIYYLFSSDTRPYSPLTGYTDIEGTFLTERYGRIKINRELDEEKVTVEAENEEVENGEYDTNYKVDNLNVIPQDLDFNVKRVNVITYYKDEKDGHVYGFMPSWRKDLPKESI